MNHCLLVGDIGGTNARFALADIESPGFSRELTFKCRDFTSADLAIRAYLKEIKAPRPSVICIAAAGPVIDGTIRFTNNGWSIRTHELENEFEGAHVSLLNDFEAVACSIPHLRAKEYFQVGMAAPLDFHQVNYTIGIIGPGTGLGVAGLCKRRGHVFPLVGEGGHIGFSPETQIQVELLAQLRDEFDRVSDERLVSGPGVVNIYRALSNIRNEKITNVNAAKIFSLASQGGNSTAAETVQVFYEVLGQVAGNLALYLGATQGIFIAGGIVTRNPELIANSRFRTGFERKGRHRSLMERIPTYVVSHPQPGLLGASCCALDIVAGKNTDS